MRKSLLSLLAVTTLMLSATQARADDFYQRDATPSGGEMAVDLLVIRPLGLVATVLGTGLFVLQLPLALIQGEVPYGPAEKLVVAPARFTFTRPLGASE